MRTDLWTRYLALPLLALGLVPGLWAEADADVLAAEKGWAAAVTALDYAALNAVLHDELIYAHSTGAIETKAEYLGKLKSGAQKYDAIDHHQTTIRSFKGAAVAHSIVTMKGVSKGVPFDNKLMMIHTWVLEGGHWRLAAHQTTRLTE